MILQAIEAGVPEERIAKALNVTAKTIRDSKNRLNGICKEAIETLKDKPIADVALRSLKKVKSYRQIEMAGLMTMSNTFTTSYAKALLAATPADQLLEPPKPDTRPEQIAKLERDANGRARLRGARGVLQPRHTQPSGRSRLPEDPAPRTHA